MRPPSLCPPDQALRMTFPGFVFRTLVSEGYEHERLLANTGLTKEALFDPDFKTGFPPLQRLLRNALEQTGEPHLGIRLARKFEATFIGLPAYAAMNAATFGDALTVLSRFFFLAFPAVEFTFPDTAASPRPGECVIRLRTKLALGDVAYFAIASALIVCEGLCSAILRTPKVALRGELTLAQPEGWADVEDQVGFPVGFDAQEIRLILPQALLAEAPPGADPLNHRRLSRLCEELAQREQGTATVAGEVASFLEEEDHLALPLAQVAAALGYSERGLRRNLARSGTTFRTLVNEIRERRARAMLENTSLPIKTIADTLGFDTPSNFARSFKRWTGASPSTFRAGKAK